MRTDPRSECGHEWPIGPAERSDGRARVACDLGERHTTTRGEKSVRARLAPTPHLRFPSKSLGGWLEKLLAGNFLTLKPTGEN